MEESCESCGECNRARNLKIPDTPGAAIFAVLDTSESHLPFVEICFRFSSWEVYDDDHDSGHVF